MPSPRFQLSRAGLRQHSFRLAAVVVVFTIACGIICGFGILLRKSREVATIHPVAGTGMVTLRGKPQKDWQVVFVYDEFDMQGATAIGVTDEDGRFTVTTPSLNATGIYPGRYKVGLVPPKRPQSRHTTGSGFMSGQFMFPRRFADPNKSGLEIEVRQGGNNDFAFELSHKSEKR